MSSLLQNGNNYVFTNRVLSVRVDVLDFTNLFKLLYQITSH